jgi:Family of unknown function (DUF6011)
MEHKETEMQNTCNRCGRVLTSAESIARGYGAWCAWLQWAEEKAEADRERMIAAVLGVKPETTSKALELIDDGGIVFWAVRLDVLNGELFSRYRVVSSDGTRYYNTSYSTCCCEAGAHGYTCYHVVAVRIIEENGSLDQRGRGYLVS